MRVALRLPRVDAGHRDGDLDRGRGGIGVVEHNGSLDSGEAALDGGNHQVTDRELDVAVRGVDRPGGAGGGGGLYGAHGFSLYQVINLR